MHPHKPNADTIVYTLISRGGGVDGRDPTDEPGRLVGAFLAREEAEKAPSRLWCDVVPQVVDMNEAKKAAVAKLDPIDRLALRLTPAGEPVSPMTNIRALRG